MGASAGRSHFEKAMKRILCLFALFLTSCQTDRMATRLVNSAQGIIEARDPLHYRRELDVWLRNLIPNGAKRPEVLKQLQGLQKRNGREFAIQDNISNPYTGFIVRPKGQHVYILVMIYYDKNETVRELDFVQGYGP